MKTIKLWFILIYIFCISGLFGQCPQVIFIMVDACNGQGSERDNEFFVLHSGAGFAVNNLSFTTPTGTVMATSQNDNDFHHVLPCPTCLSGCTFHFLTNGDQVPANRNVVIFTSRNLNFLTYDFTGICEGGEVYVLVANSTPGTGQFANYSPANCSACNPTSGDPFRTTTVGLTNGCIHDATYHRCLLRNISGACGAQDGGAVSFVNGTAFYNNNGCAAPSLPVLFGQMSLHRLDTGIQVYWATTQEINNAFFTVEHSVDGTHFIPLGRIPGAGNSRHVNSYSLEDINPVRGENCYRIKQTDVDGKFDYSDTYCLFWGNLLPNIQFSIQGRKAKTYCEQLPYFVELFTTTGQSLKRMVIHEEGFEWDMDDWPSGVYIFMVHDAISFQTKKVVLR